MVRTEDAAPIAALLHFQQYSAWWHHEDMLAPCHHTTQAKPTGNESGKMRTFKPAASPNSGFSALDQAASAR
jgi:hypothetical protein